MSSSSKSDLHDVYEYESEDEPDDTFDKELSELFIIRKKKENRTDETPAHEVTSTLGTDDFDPLSEISPIAEVYNESTITEFELETEVKTEPSRGKRRATEKSPQTKYSYTDFQEICHCQKCNLKIEEGNVHAARVFDLNEKTTELKRVCHTCYFSISLRNCIVFSGSESQKQFMEDYILVHHEHPEKRVYCQHCKKRLLFGHIIE